MKRILVVEDDIATLEVIKLILEKNQYEVVTHDTGYNVPQIVKKYKPDLILLDILLPGKLGTEICHELKAVNKWPPIILCSAHADKLEAFALCDADGFIHKPFDVPTFLKTIRSHVE